MEISIFNIISIRGHMWKIKIKEIFSKGNLQALITTGDYETTKLHNLLFL